MSTPYTKPRPVRIAGAVLAALSIIAGGVTSIAGLQDNPTLAVWAGLVTLTVGALTATLIPVLEGQVTPAGDVVAYLDTDRQVVPGPAQADLVDEPAAPANLHPDAEYDGKHRPNPPGLSP